MIAVRIGEFDSTENGLISTNTSFRQISLVKDPHKYGQSVEANNSVANTVISQTTRFDMIAGSPFSLNEFVYQGSLSNPTAYGYITDQTATTAQVSKVKGTFTPGLIVTGATSGTSRTTTTITNPEFQPYSGEILYVTNEKLGGCKPLCCCRCCGGRGGRWQRRHLRRALRRRPRLPRRPRPRPAHRSRPRPAPRPRPRPRLQAASGPLTPGASGAAV